MANQRPNRKRNEAPVTYQNKGLFRLLYLVAIFVVFYLIFTIAKYKKDEQIFSYQVKEGTLAVSNIYTGVILRDEQIVPTSSAGYLNYFAREGEHVGVNDLVYAVDSTDIMKTLISNGTPGENSLSDEDLKELKGQVVAFQSTFDSRYFGDVYDFLYNCDGTVLKLANLNVLDSIDNLGNGIYAEQIHLCNAAGTGYVIYHTDGYESLSENGITKEVFDRDAYEKEQIINGVWAESGDPAYKLIHSEDWNIVIPISEEKAQELRNESYLQIRFLKTQNTTWATSHVFQNGDEYYLSLGLNNSLIQFSTDRYIEIELMEYATKGLKIPVSSIVYKDFYIIPEEYAVQEGEDNTIEFLKKSFNDDGTIGSELISIEVYALVDGEYYVDNSQLHSGDYLILPYELPKKPEPEPTPVESLSENEVNEDEATGNPEVITGPVITGAPAIAAPEEETPTTSHGITINEEYAISRIGNLMGVYNINKGYADFRRIIILYQNDEYAIVKSNTEYGLNVYDYIVLDSNTVQENEFIYE